MQATATQKEHAGVYEGYEDGYHNNGNIPVKIETLDNLFIYISEMGVRRLPNHNSVWKQIGYKLVKGELIKL